uniref:Secreted protein n=1 Tax=Rhizophora mucronata TaxID=61149 RepID=A0A2P2NN31_RHIMU
MLFKLIFLSMSLFWSWISFSFALSCYSMGLPPTFHNSSAFHFASKAMLSAAYTLLGLCLVDSQHTHVEMTHRKIRQLT